MSVSRIGKPTTVQKSARPITCKCGHQWLFTGKAEYVCSCPRCHTTIRLHSKKKSHTGDVAVK